MSSSGPFDFLVEPLVGVVGLPVDQTKFLLIVLLSYPLGFGFRLLPSAQLKHLYSSGIGLFFMFFCFGYVGWVHFFATSLFIYASFFLVPPQYLPKLAFFFLFIYLSSLHIYRMIIDYMGYSMDTTALMMVLIVKLSILACNYSDGVKEKQEKELLTQISRENAISVVPGFLEYISYLAWFPTMLSGPAFHFTHYKNWIENQHHVPSPWKQTGLVFLSALLHGGLYVFLTQKFPVEICFVPHGMDHMPFISKLFYIWIATFGVRNKYYFIWKLTEGSGVLSGLGYGGVDESGNPKWDRLTNIEVWKVESCTAARDISTFWNSKTGDWLKNYIYFRQSKNPASGSVPTYALYLTNTASAFWHGFYPGYYLSFVFTAITVDLSRQVHSFMRPYVESSERAKQIGEYLSRLIAIITLNYGFLSFIGLSMDRSLNAFRSVGYFGHITVFLIYVGLYVAKRIIKKPRTPKAQTDNTPIPSSVPSSAPSSEPPSSIPTEGSPEPSPEPEKLKNE